MSKGHENGGVSVEMTEDEFLQLLLVSLLVPLEEGIQVNFIILFWETGSRPQYMRCHKRRKIREIKESATLALNDENFEVTGLQMRNKNTGNTSRAFKALWVYNSC